MTLRGTERQVIYLLEIGSGTKPIALPTSISSQGGFKGKENMGRRKPRAVEETYIGLRKRRQKRFVQASLMRKKRFSNIPMGMMSLAVGQVANAVGTVVLER